MVTIEQGDFYDVGQPRKVVGRNHRRCLMPVLRIMSVVGSAVPEKLRDLGLLACWYVVRDGEPISGPLPSLPHAKQAHATLNAEQSHALA
jgi:hypothetical protein